MDAEQAYNDPTLSLERRSTVRRTTYWERSEALKAGEAVDRTNIQKGWHDCLEEHEFYVGVANDMLDAGFAEGDSPVAELILYIDYLEEESAYWRQLDFDLCVIVDRQPRPLPVSTNRSFQLMNNRWAYASLRFTVPELQKMFQAFNFPLVIRPGNRYRFESEEAFIITMFRITSGMKFTAKADSIFGQDSRRMSFVYTNG